MTLQIMRLNWDVNTRAGRRPTKVEKGSAVLRASSWLEILDLIIRANPGTMGLLNIIIKISVRVITTNY